MKTQWSESRGQQQGQVSENKISGSLVELYILSKSHICNILKNIFYCVLTLTLLQIFSIELNV